MKLTDYTQANKAAWNASAEHHAKGTEWQALLDGFTNSDFSTLDATLTETLSAIPLEGKSVVQVGCNNGRELLSTFALGATCGLGIDVSDEFIGAAEQLNAVAKRDCDFLCSDIYALPETVRRDFDVALITIGVINWMPDPGQFFTTIASLINPGGSLVVYETHPILEVFDPHSDDPFKPVSSYFKKTPWVDTHPIVYDGAVHDEISPSYWFNHTLGTVVTSCVDGGLSIQALHEHPHSNREVDYDVYRNQEAQLPMCFTLVATKV